MARRVVIIGGGFGGLTAAQALRDAPVDVLLIDRTNHHLFQPLLYQVATAALSPADIAVPLRAILRGQRNVAVRLGDAVAIDRERRIVQLDDGEIPFDVLIVAPGSRHAYFGHPEWESHAPGLKTIEDALTIRDRILLGFEHAAAATDPDAVRRALTFVVVGGGPTGVELAGAIAEIACRGLLADYPTLPRDQVHILLLEAGARILSSFHPALSSRAQRLLEQRGVEVRLRTAVTAVSDKGVTAGSELIETATVIWAPGTIAPPLLRTLDTPLGKHGQVVVEPDLTVPGDPDVFVIGDAAQRPDASGRLLPALAPVAMQQARYVGALIVDRTPPGRRPPFRYVDRGIMTTIGRAHAVVEVGRFRTAGVFAWLLWSFVHIFFLIGFRNRIRVMLEWMWYYVTLRPGARIIYRRR